MGRKTKVSDIWENADNAKIAEVVETIDAAKNSEVFEISESAELFKSSHIAGRLSNNMC